MRLKLCNHPACNEFVKSGYCEKHKPTYARHVDFTYMYNNSRWRNYRIRFLKENPFCCECEKKGRMNPATVVDHVKPHKGDIVSFWDKANHQSLCAVCHNRKTATENGGFKRRG